MGSATLAVLHLAAPTTRRLRANGESHVLPLVILAGRRDRASSNWVIVAARRPSLVPWDVGVVEDGRAVLDAKPEGLSFGEFIGVILSWPNLGA